MWADCLLILCYFTAHEHYLWAGSTAHAKEKTRALRRVRRAGSRKYSPNAAEGHTASLSASPCFYSLGLLDAQHVPQVDAGDFSRMEIAHLGAVQLHAEDAVEAHFLQGGFHRGEVHRAVAQGPEGAHLIAALGLGQGVGVHVL